MPRTGRPKLILNQDLFEDLCRIQCTEAEIASLLKCSVDTLERWCKRIYSKTFAEAYKRLSDGGKESLRRAQYKLALKGNATMLIWLGKQVLKQTDKVEIDHRIADEINAELARLGLTAAEAVSGTAEGDTKPELVN